MSAKSKNAVASNGSIPTSLLWAARTGFAAALAISIYLAWVSLSTGHPVGCGPESGCDRVLHSKWAYWLGVPVSVFAVVIYLVILLASASLGASMPVARQRRAWDVMLPCALLVISAAVWFVALQFFVVRSICPYCMTAHVLGFVSALLVLKGSPPRKTPEKPWELEKLVFLSPRSVRRAAVVGVIGLGVLIAGQVAYTPPTSKEVRQQDILAAIPTNKPVATNAVSTPPPVIVASNPPAVVVTPPKSNPPPVIAPPGVTSLAVPAAPRIFPVYQGRFSLNVAEVPVMGAATNSQVMVSLFDYTCHHCRAMHPILKEVQQAFSNRLVIASLPMPLDPTCNQTVQRKHPDHANACEYARIGLAVWRAAPAKHDEFEEWIFAGEKPPPLEATQARARQLLGDAVFEKTIADAWVELQLKLNVAIYELAFKSGQGSMPQMMIGSKVAVGTYPKDDLMKLLSTELGLKP